MRRSTLATALAVLNDEALLVAIGRQIIKRMAFAMALGLVAGLLLGWALFA